MVVVKAGLMEVGCLEKKNEVDKKNEVEKNQKGMGGNGDGGGGWLNGSGREESRGGKGVGYVVGREGGGGEGEGLRGVLVSHLA